MERDTVRANISANTMKMTMATVPSLRNGRVHRAEINGRRIPAQVSQRRPAGVCVRQSWQYGVRHRPHRNSVVRPACRVQPVATEVWVTTDGLSTVSGWRAPQALQKREPLVNGARQATHSTGLSLISR